MTTNHLYYTASTDLVIVLWAAYSVFTKIRIAKWSQMFPHWSLNKKTSNNFCVGAKNATQSEDDECLINEGTEPGGATWSSWSS